MSLVAYGSSDEDSGNEEHEPAVAVTAIDTNNDADIKTVNVHTSLKLSLPTPTVVLNTNGEQEEIEDENDDENGNVVSSTGNLKHFFHTLPKPKNLNSAEAIEEKDDIPSEKETENLAVTPTATKKQTIKITVPSLSEFKDVEEENEKKPIRIVQSAEKRCGLFSLLVPPKEGTVNKKILIPHTVKNATANTQQMKTINKSSTNHMSDSKARTSTVDKTHKDLSSDDEEDAADFFGLSTSKNMPDDSILRLDSELSTNDLINKSSDEETLLPKQMKDHTAHNSFNSDISTDSQSSHSKILTSNVMNLPKEEILMKNKAEIGPKLPVPEQEYNVDKEGNVAFDEKAIEYLCGKRGIKRKDKEIDEADIIEINGEDIKPDEREWLVKALTEEPVHRPISMQSCGINSQSKKKHQITYLAHQAKAMELELKNQWSQNRMTRKQTKSKYGF